VNDNKHLYHIKTYDEDTGDLIRTLNVPPLACIVDIFELNSGHDFLLLDEEMIEGLEYRCHIKITMPDKKRKHNHYLEKQHKE
jgi:hypothetical protein